MSPPLDVAAVDDLILFPRAIAFSEATALEPLPNLSEDCNGTKLFIKRDDCNSLAFGGNKVRQLEYYFGDAIAQGADTVLITGAVQSNFARITAGFAAKLGMQCHIQLESRVDTSSDSYHSSGNVLLDRLFGAQLHYFPEGENEDGADAKLEEMADALRLQGRKPYVIHLGLGHKPYGALGYVRCAAEIVRQLRKQDLQIDEIFVASGSGSTHAGLLFGLRAFGCDSKVTGVCVRRKKELQIDRIRAHCIGLVSMLNFDPDLKFDDFRVIDEVLRPGYGQASPQVWEAMLCAARREGLVLDPTYSGKTMAAFLSQARQSPTNSNLLFIHTGGTPGIFAYQDQLEKYLS